MKWGRVRWVRACLENHSGRKEGRENMVWQGDGVQMERVGGIKSYLGGGEMRMRTLPHSQGQRRWSWDCVSRSRDGRTGISLRSVIENLRPGSILKPGSNCQRVFRSRAQDQVGPCCLFTHLVSTAALGPRLRIHSFTYLTKALRTSWT